MIDWNRWSAGCTVVAGSDVLMTGFIDKETRATSIDTPPEFRPDKQTKDARQLALLGILLQALHVLFGVTAIIGVLVTQTRAASTDGTVYRSQLRWQFGTFCIAMAGYAIAFYIWATQQNPWFVPAVLAIVTYRLWVSTCYWIKRRALCRIL